jgi:hypothetical protein
MKDSLFSSIAQSATENKENITKYTKYLLAFPPYITLFSLTIFLYLRKFKPKCDGMIGWFECFMEGWCSRGRLEIIAKETMSLHPRRTPCYKNNSLFNKKNLQFF